MSTNSPRGSIIAWSGEWSSCHPAAAPGEWWETESDVNEQFIQRIEDSFKLLAPRGEELVDRFYANLFARHPAVRPLFPAEMKSQESMLLAALVLAVKSLRDPDNLRAALLGLGARHEEIGMREEHYPVVRDTLVDVMGQMAGDAWTSQLNDDWTAAIDFVASVMIEGQKATAASCSPEN